MIVESGVDIIEIERIKKAIKRNDRFPKRIFCKGELDYISERKGNINTIAGMFAAKEAVSKVLGCGFGKIKWKDIRILHDKLGKPIVCLNDNAKKIADDCKIDRIVLTITHIHKYALAFAIGENGYDKKEIKENNIAINEYNLDNRKNDLLRLPTRKNDSHKGTYGKVVIIAGSKGMSGACCLSCMSALKSGTGLVYAVIPETINTIIEMKLTEVITRPINDEGKGYFIKDNLKEIKQEVDKADVIALGPGIGKDKDRVHLVKNILQYTDKTVVLDADGLNCISNDTDILRYRDGITVLTPHPGELARLLNVDINKIQSNRLYYSKIASQKLNSIVVLKGHETIVCKDDKEVYINDTGNPGMATAGSGDVLTGIITSFIGQNIGPYKSAVIGVFLHGLAGDIASKEKGRYGLIASDILNKVPEAIKLLVDT